MQHVIVYRESGRFAGWPANYGIWSWGDEIVVGFTTGYTDPAGGFHARDKTRPFLPMQARSLDGGLTWKTGPTPCRLPGGRGLSADEHMLRELWAQTALERGLENMPGDCPGDIDFTHPDFALMCARTGLGAGTVAWFYLSADRCRSWQGPYKLSSFGLPGVEARTDYLVSGPQTCSLFLTASKVDGGEGDHIFMARTTDGGKSFGYVSRVTHDYGAGFAIMPASARLDERQIRVAVRCSGGDNAFGSNPCWIDLYASEDDGATWRYLGRPVPDTGRGGNPPTLTRLHDRRLCLAYGYRNPPYGVRARISEDGGETWGDEIVLRDDAGNHDIGYPRTALRPDGTLVTVYYTNDTPEGDRYIAATLWRP
jgi:hypothetical protein